MENLPVIIRVSDDSEEVSCAVCVACGACNACAAGMPLAFWANESLLTGLMFFAAK